MGRLLVLALGVLGAGAALIAWGWIRQGTSGYLSQLLLELGAGLFLLVPLTIIAYTLRQRVDQFESSIEEVRDAATAQRASDRGYDDLQTLRREVEERAQQLSEEAGRLAKLEAALLQQGEEARPEEVH
jgi:hypothetical protein